MNYQRKYNFSPGPSQLPEEVLVSVQSELLNYQGSGSSVMELSHRGAEFQSIIKQTESLLRELLTIDDNYQVLFLQGGASAQFTNIPLNFLKPGQIADYLVTGQWSKKAVEEAKRIGQVNVVADGKASNYLSLPELDSWKLSDQSCYLHLASNETIGGLQFKSFPNSKSPLIADMSSDILSRRFDINQFAMVYAGAQKNLGPAGVTLVIVRKDLLATANVELPVYLNYQTHAEADSCYNTPPCFSIYVMGEVLKWIKEQSFDHLIANNQKKANLLYDFIDQSSFYSNPVQKEFRSEMNVPFLIADNSLENKFLYLAKENGLLNLQGHRSVGGMRASIYNAMPYAGVEALVNFMKNFEKECA